MLHKRSEHDVNPIVLFPKDTLQVTYIDKEGTKHVLPTERIGDTLTVNKVVVFDLDSEMGLKKGIGAAIGEKDAPA